jgi:hypothetical protein
LHVAQFIEFFGGDRLADPQLACLHGRYFVIRFTGTIAARRKRARGSLRWPGRSS